MPECCRRLVCGVPQPHLSFEPWLRPQPSPPPPDQLPTWFAAFLCTDCSLLDPSTGPGSGGVGCVQPGPGQAQGQGAQIRH